MEFLRLSKLVPLELQYVWGRGLASASITSWKWSNKLIMEILTIYYRYSIQRLTWDIKNLKQNIFFTFQPYLVIQWSSIHNIIRGPMPLTWKVVSLVQIMMCINFDVSHSSSFNFKVTVSPRLDQVSVSKV